MSTATSNPQGGFSAQAADPCAVVIFGASGDLARRKVIPAFYDLAARDALATRYAIVGSLVLYISFINLFLSILRILGDRR